jgi:uncharacterized protein (TIGR02453 family)
MAAAHFSPKLFKFLRDLKNNNDRAWFQDNRERFEADVRAPLMRFVADFGPHLAKISRRFVADPRPSGGSIFRIHRDTRFSKDKSPYKTHAAAQFRHEVGKDVHAPGFYLHLQPGEVFGGFGLWHPEPEPLAKIRDAIVEDPARWKRAVGKQELGGESLKRPPAGYPADHPLIADLKRKDFITSATFSEGDACKPGFIAEFAGACRDAAPLMQFLTAAVGLPW